MADLGDVPWPPDPRVTPRLRLRRTEARDRDACIDLMCSDEVRRYLGGPQPREEVERSAPEVPGDRPGVFAVEADGALIGNVFVNRRDPDRPGHLGRHGNEVEVGYLFLPAFWGRGYATEAVAAVLEWIAHVLPGEPVVLCTQTANVASVRLAATLGFVEQERFVEFDAEQWFGVRTPVPAVGPPASSTATSPATASTAARSPVNREWNRVSSASSACLSTTDRNLGSSRPTTPSSASPTTHAPESDGCSNGSCEVAYPHARADHSDSEEALCPQGPECETGWFRDAR